MKGGIKGPYGTYGIRLSQHTFSHVTQININIGRLDVKNYIHERCKICFLYFIHFGYDASSPAWFINHTCTKSSLARQLLNFRQVETRSTLTRVQVRLPRSYTYTRLFVLSCTLHTWTIRLVDRSRQSFSFVDATESHG